MKLKTIKPFFPIKLASHCALDQTVPVEKQKKVNINNIA